MVIYGNSPLPCFSFMKGGGVNKFVIFFVKFRAELMKLLLQNLEEEKNDEKRNFERKKKSENITSGRAPPECPTPQIDKTRINLYLKNMFFCFVILELLSSEPYLFWVVFKPRVRPWALCVLYLYKFCLKMTTFVLGQATQNSQSWLSWS